MRILLVFVVMSGGEWGLFLIFIGVFIGGSGVCVGFLISVVFVCVI